MLYFCGRKDLNLIFEFIYGFWGENFIRVAQRQTTAAHAYDDNDKVSGLAGEMLNIKTRIFTDTHTHTHTAKGITTLLKHIL